MTNKRAVGNLMEEKAADYLKSQGMKIIDRNYSTRYGEIDIIAMEENVLVFLEVKYRTNLKFGFPEEAVNRQKQRKIHQVAKWYLYEKNYAENIAIRFDVVSILGSQIKIIRNAF